jgi:predicted MPP superfamily phosphohydrolase
VIVRRLVLAALALVLLAGALFALGVWNARADPVVRRVSLALPRWPAGAAPVTVALVSDVHLGDLATDEARLTRIADRVTALRPDLIVLAGDFVTGHDPGRAAEEAAALTRALSRLRAPLGTIAVLGNHDYWTGAPAVRRALAAAGITLLENRAVRRGPLAVGGVADEYTHHDRVGATLAQVRALGLAPLIVTHSPDIAPMLGAGTPVLLAGHMHCGQVVLPLIGAPSVPSRFGRRYLCGVVREGPRTVVVTSGTGTSSLPIRFGAAPDVWLVRVGPMAERRR